MSLSIGVAKHDSGGKKVAVSGLAAVSPSIRKGILEQLSASPKILAASEAFLKSVLKHSVLKGESPIVKQLVGRRVSLYFRVGRLLQAWPSTASGAGKQVALVEAKYAEEMVQSHATVRVITPLYGKLVMTLTVADLDAENPKKRAKKTDEDLVLSATGAECAGDDVILPQDFAPSKGLVK